MQKGTGAYQGTVNYVPVPASFFADTVSFSADSSDTPCKVDPSSPVYGRALRDFSQSEYKHPAAPLYLGQEGVSTPSEEVYVLRLLIKAPGTDFFVPGKLDWLIPMIRKSAAYQRAHFPDFDSRFVYITVRSGVVKSSRDDEFHVDGFQGISVPRHVPEQNYIWCDTHPTMFAVQPYYLEGLDPARHNVHEYIERCTDKTDLTIINERGLYIMDPYHAHARPSVPEGTQRTFVRICYSPVEIRDDTNTVNPALPRGPYNRGDIRNTLVPYDGNH